MFVHFRSFSIIFFHVLSFSFMFFHFLLFSFIFFVFVGCSKYVFFLGVNFVTISLDSSYVKKQSIFGPISGGTPLGPLFLLPPIFSRVFLSFFIAFYFFIFLSFFVHFFIF